jgi:phosphate/sulfate permease
VSTTQVITGALIAVGLTEGVRGVNWWACLRVRSFADLSS